MRTITGTIRTTPTQWLPVLSNIAPPQTRRLTALKSQVDKIDKNPTLPIHTDFGPLINERPRLKSRNPRIRTARHLADFDPQDHWRTHWRQHETKNCDLIENPAGKVPGFVVKRREWYNLNRIRHLQ
nr:unnamed protein product [Callosobruchus analis]